METVLLSVLAETRWDFLRSTAQKASDALRLFPAHMAGPFLEAGRLDEVFKRVQETTSNFAWFKSWAGLFTAREATWIESALKALGKEESVEGWTASNSLRRLRLQPSHVDHVRQLLRECTNPTIQWRAAHTLGAFPSSENAAALFLALKSSGDQWVKYGSIRSLIEHAARHSGLRSKIISRLQSDVGRLSEERQVLRELQSALLVEPNHLDGFVTLHWMNAITPLVETYHDAERSVGGRVRWQSVAYELRKAYGQPIQK
jgi:hypothetical protein